MASKPFEEKQIAKEIDKEKEALKLEKNEKIEKHEKHEKSEKAEKDNPDTKQHKDSKDNPDTKHKQEKEKHEKEQKHEKSEKHEKLEHKEQLIEKQPKDVETAQVSFAAQPAGIQKFADKLPQAETKFTKEIKSEIKEIKHEKVEKFEIKEHKIEKHEKIEFKDFKVEKLEYEGIGGVTDPGGPVEQRLAALEAAMAQLLHFIPENLRPDLSQGALKQEPDAAKQKPADPKAEPKPKS